MRRYVGIAVVVSMMLIIPSVSASETVEAAAVPFVPDFSALFEKTIPEDTPFKATAVRAGVLADSVVDAVGVFVDGTID